MIRMSILVLLCTLCAWVPWMDRKPSEEMVQTILAAYGDMPASCYDSEGVLLQEGVSVRWYPMGRMVHTCQGDYVIWFWGAVKELGGVAKKAIEIQATHSKPLSCDEVLLRQEARRATSTDSELVPYTGTPARTPDFSIFPEASEQRTIITTALSGGVDFAGRFAVAEWSCGPSCHNFALIDVETGQVVSFGPPTEYGIEWSQESTVLVTNPLALLPPLPDNAYETESMALSLTRLERRYYRLTYDVLSGTRYLVLQCVESAATGYIEVENDTIGVVTND